MNATFVFPLFWGIWKWLEHTEHAQNTPQIFFLKMKQKQHAQNTPGTHPSFFKNQRKTNMPGTHPEHVRSMPKIIFKQWSKTFYC